MNFKQSSALSNQLLKLLKTVNHMFGNSGNET